MKIRLLIIFFLIAIRVEAQEEQFHTERYEVIKGLLGNGERTLDRNFLPFMGVGVFISDPALMDNLLGHCIDYDKKEFYSYADVISDEEIRAMNSQISRFSYSGTLDSKKLPKNIKIANDKNNNLTAITVPLVFNDKAIVYETNKDSQETIHVLVKIDGEWKVRCQKYTFMVFRCD